MELPDRYNPQDVENRIYQWWVDGGYFKAADTSTKVPFSIILPPPNVTGQLHLGHALDHTLQDVLARWKRMSGFNVLWMPGTDHAGIATQSVVERELKKEGLTRQELGREKFVERVWAWKDQYGSRIVEQMKRLGDSCDWDRLTFTLDDGPSRAVRKVFVDLFKKGLIYKGLRLINWSSALESAISDLEVEHREVKGAIYHIRYDLADGNGGSLEVATTRPETLLGDTALAVHPADERFARLIGRKVKLPLTAREIPIVADAYVDREFGSGVVKITPAHDFNDYAVGQRHKLPMLNILNKNGTLNEVAGVYEGLKVAEARKRVIADLEAQGHLVKTEPHVHQVGHCSRTGCVVEPFLSEQWFVKMADLATPARRVVESGTVLFEPESWTKTYLHWMSIIGDWCISRQLWWGHRIPAYTCGTCQKITVAEGEPAKCDHCGATTLTQDEDVLDTWFSSALWPFSTMGWPADTELQKTFYPTSVLVTGSDIIFFWVARMIMLGLEFKADVPFRTVYIHGLIRDAQGRKMSKSLGNSEDPVKLIEDFGADALRFTLLAQISGGRDLKFSTQRLEGYRNFMNKIWNAARFSLNVLKDFKAPAERAAALPHAADLGDADQWVLFKLGEVETLVNEALKEYRFSDAALGIYAFTWNIFCDWYLEFVKAVVRDESLPSERKHATELTLALVLDRIVHLLHPFAPYITEEIYQKLPLSAGALVISAYPSPKADRALTSLGNALVAAELDLVREVITAIRNIRGENRIKPGEQITVLLATEARGQEILNKNLDSIVRLARTAECAIGQTFDMAKSAVQPVVIEGVRVDVIVPLEGLVDFDEEIKRITKAIEKLTRDAASLEKRLGDAKFLANAPPEILEQGRTQLAESKQQMTTLEAALARLN